MRDVVTNEIAQLAKKWSVDDRIHQKWQLLIIILTLKRIRNR